MTMATGGTANVLYRDVDLPLNLRFPGLYTIGCLFFILNIVPFIFNVLMISTRFYLYPSTFKVSILHPTERLFVPAAVISYGTILLNITQYGLEVGKTKYWLHETRYIMYWIYCALAVLSSCGICLVLWPTQTFTISQMTPVWIFPAYPFLIVGPHAGQIASAISGTRALDMIIGGVLPKKSIRPGMFISVGPSGSTVSGIITMGRNLPRVIADDFTGNGQLADQVSNWIGIWLWGLALWFFLPMHILSCVMACLLILVWMFVFASMVRAVVRKDIL
ncbi:voltage-dependent anion channel-domain-containing protein [Cryomyces antarcticus]